jgi:phosphopantothenoylcysteine decarboxylase / phosphopantothenate---cysteine ligase
MSRPLPEQHAPVILMGITGGVAAYKAVDAASRLKKAGYTVQVAMTEAATRFISPLTFAAVTGHRVMTTMFPDPSESNGNDLYPHLYPSTSADIFIVMPATANILAKLAHGEGADPVSVSALSLPPSCKRIFCPAMNVEMWKQDVVQDNARHLEDRGWIRLGPDHGLLACGMEGAGRMVEPHEVVDYVQNLLRKQHALSGKHVLIFSGPTREHLDPVRFISNESSGRMGKALADEAQACGASVTFITGPVDQALLPLGSHIHTHEVTSAQEMLEAGEQQVDQADIVIFAAAVADYQAVTVSSEKTEKKNDEFNLALKNTPDIAATLAGKKKKDQVFVGYALQSGEGLHEAHDKMQRKKFDYILLNHPESMGAQQAAYTMLSPTLPEPQVWGMLDKRAVASRLFEMLVTSR